MTMKIIGTSDYVHKPRTIKLGISNENDTESENEALAMNTPDKEDAEDKQVYSQESFGTRSANQLEMEAAATLTPGQEGLVDTAEILCHVLDEVEQLAVYHGYLIDD